ncbi:TatD family hydrolase [Treponema sp.]|uniref:TatD family hydrolase n=1 Tax=Treponema sp. TaxID=166 RepID=UPI00388E232E
MFSDTHFHFSMMMQEERSSILTALEDRKCFFGLDIGTRSDDLAARIEIVKNSDSGKKIKQFMYFSTGIWPAVEAIKDRENQIKELEKQILSVQELDAELKKKICAIGECGLDHHWNPSGTDGRCESDFDREVFLGEAEMFEMQLELAKKFNLPVIVHSRDAFEGTLECIKNISYDNGIIHCYSYGLEEAKAFLDRGWYLAFGGGVTYTKKSKMEQMKELLCYVPKERLLLETDAPYLAPVPFRGKPNTPLLIDNTYNFIARMRGTSAEELSDMVDENIRRLFKL